MIVGRLWQTALAKWRFTETPYNFLSPNGEDSAERDAAEKVIAGID